MACKVSAVGIIIDVEGTLYIGVDFNDLRGSEHDDIEGKGSATAMTGAAGATGADGTTTVACAGEEVDGLSVNGVRAGPVVARASDDKAAATRFPTSSSSVRMLDDLLATVSILASVAVAVVGKGGGRTVGF
jgi:hypothetical protein